MLLAVPYLLAASICFQLIAGGGPVWLHLLVLLFIYNATKSAIMGPVSLVLPVRTRLREHTACHRDRRADHGPWLPRRSSMVGT